MIVLNNLDSLQWNSKACAAPQHTASWLTMVASFGSKPGNGKSEVKAMTNHQSRECRNVYISSSEPPVQWPVEAVPKKEDFPASISRSRASRKKVSALNEVHISTFSLYDNLELSLWCWSDCRSRRWQELIEKESWEENPLLLLQNKFKSVLRMMNKCHCNHVTM